jgi:hypothetical protein
MPATLALIVIPAQAGIQARPTRLAQQDDENDSPPTEGTVRHPSADGGGPGVGSSRESVP